MTRLAALIVTLVLASGPVLAGLCEHPCGESPARKAANCHGDVNATTKIADGHDCNSHTVDAAPATRAETRYELRLTVIASTLDISTVVQPVVASTAVAAVPFDPGTPHLSALTPLRI